MKLFTLVRNFLLFFLLLSMGRRNLKGGGGVNFFHPKIEKKRNPKSNEANVRVLFLSLHSPRPRCYANTSNPRINTSKCKTNTANHSVLTPQDLNYYHLSSFPSAWFYIFFLFPLPFRNKNREPPKPCFTSSNERIIRLSIKAENKLSYLNIFIYSETWFSISFQFVNDTPLLFE